MPVNPYDKKSDHDKWNDFEGFRQAHSFKATGKLPADRDVFHRSEVEIVFEEYDSWLPSGPVFLNLDDREIKQTIVTHVIWSKDVHEVIKFKSKQLVN